MGNKTILIIAIALLLVAIAGGGYLWWSIKSGTVVPSPSPVASPTTESVLTPAPTATTEVTEAKPILEQIKEAFAEKYNKPVEDAIVNISENTGTHASGGIKFTGEISGAMWLAYNDGEKWVLVFDGHGTIPCSAVDPHDFPTDMVPECWDEATNTLIQR